MTALQITDLKHFMNSLLKTGLFDHFLLQEATITQAVSYSIDGKIHPDFFSEEDPDAAELQGLEYMPFSHIRPVCFDLIRGKKRPLSFRFVFRLSPKNQESTLAQAGTSFSMEDISAMYLNLTYKNNMLTCTTGISYRMFSTDRSLEQEWDRLVTLFLKRNQIAVIPL